MIGLSMNMDKARSHALRKGVKYEVSGGIFNPNNFDETGKTYRSRAINAGIAFFVFGGLLFFMAFLFR